MPFITPARPPASVKTPPYPILALGVGPGKRVPVRARGKKKTGATSQKIEVPPSPPSNAVLFLLQVSTLRCPASYKLCAVLWLLGTQCVVGITLEHRAMGQLQSSIVTMKHQ